MTLANKHSPVSPEEMEHTSPKYTICELLREIYYRTDDEQIKIKCRVAVAMAKAMDTRLRELNPEWKKGFFERNEHYGHPVGQALEEPNG